MKVLSYKKKLQNLSLKYKILIIIFSGLLFLFLSGIAAMTFMTHFYEKKLYQSIAASMNYSASEISNQLQSIDSMIDSILSNQEIQSNLESMKDSTLPSEQRVYNTKIYNTLSNYLFTFDNKAVSYMSIIQDRQTISTSMFQFSELPSEICSALILKAQKEEGATAVVPDYGDTYGIFLVKELRKIDRLSLEPLGILIVNLDPKALTDTAVASYTEYDTLSCLLFHKNTLIYNGSSLSASQAADLEKHLPNSYGIKKTGSDTLFAVRGKIPIYNWDYICTVSYDSIYRTITLTGRAFFFLMVAALLIVSYLTVHLILTLFYRFDRLISNMKSFGDGKYQIPEISQDYSEDEIGLLYKSFDAMVEKINLLIQQNYVNELLKKEAQIKAMESQMDPHFLYNTLDSINWRAKMIKSEEISQITTALGGLLRLSLGKNSQDFTLHQEMDLVNNYITIQKLRFQRRLDFRAEIPEELMELPIPKFTIQPLLENSIHYGLEESSELCRITIQCHIEKAHVYIDITNTGSSFEKDFMKKLLTGEIQPHGFGIGILNIHKRLQMTYGEEYGLNCNTIKENFEECAVAQIHIPLTKEGKTC